MLWKQYRTRFIANRQVTRIELLRGTYILEALAETVSTLTGIEINKIDSALGQGEHMQ
jgi:hypothetical protein